MLSTFSRFSTWHPFKKKSYDFSHKSTTKHLSEQDVSKKIQDGHHNWLCKTPQIIQENFFPLEQIFPTKKVLSSTKRRKNNLEYGNHNARWSNDQEQTQIQRHENVLPNFKAFEKIKQVSSAKLTNWYKNISRWKTNKSFHRLIFFGANLKVSKYCS